MHKILIPVPNELFGRIRRAILKRQRSKVQDEALYQVAIAVGNDKALCKEMMEIEVTMFKDGLEDETW